MFLGGLIMNQTAVVTRLLNATLSSIKTVVPVESDIKKPELLKQDFRINYGVLIGITGDMHGKLVFGGDMATFASLSEGMYGMPLEGDMLKSFSGELGNMIAGGISTNLEQQDTKILITTPTILQGDTALSGYKRALSLPIQFQQIGHMHAYLLLD